MSHRVVAEGLQFPEGPAFDREGNLYVVEIAAGQISKIAPNGEMSIVAKPGGGPNGSNFGPDGALYLGDWGENGWAPHNQGRILKLDDPTAVNDPLAESRVFLGVVVEVHPRRVLIEARRHLVFGVLDRHSLWV